ncbi:BAH domain [Raphanus sativus]|nr:BAH domain [Raphanus sativus]
MHGRGLSEEERKKGHRRRLMFRPPSRLISSVEASPSPSSSSSLSLSSPSSFSKDGRRISVGDCALFKPPQDCPPFIGLIRLLVPEKEGGGSFKVRVNWLYRPSELKLGKGKGVPLEARPNEIFYSFHEDEIPAASLLHPCKVTFLPKGVELPSGISSFVCWRVYDVMNESIWWLTDQDYIDERQQEVDKLLCKKTLQQCGCSPRLTTSQVKTGTEGMQNSSSSSSQGKGRKRERGDQGSESVKRERPSRTDDSGSGFARRESSLKSEIAKITERGRLVDSEGVEKLVQLMLPEKNEKKTDLTGRSILAGAVAATDKFDCLSRFVQLRGLSVFDEWLQEVHKRKIGDGSSPKDNERSVDDFLLILLRALDKLPVNLNALQTCNIGKSVNRLRSHKNSEIGKKARSLVDTWKKRVEAEMDAKPGRPRQSEVSHGSRHSVVSFDATKTSVSHLHPFKSVSGISDTSVKSATTSPSSTKSAPSPGTGVAVVNVAQQRNTGALHAEVGLTRSISSQRTVTIEKAEGCSNKLMVKLPKCGERSDEHEKAVNESSKIEDIVKPTSPTLGDDVRTGKGHGESHSLMNALIESCVRDSEANACVAGADDVGMNLLATVAADEMSKSPVASPSVSRVSDSADGLPSEQAENVNPTIVEHVSSSGEQLPVVENVNDSKPGDLDENSDSEIEELQRLVDQCLESNENSDDIAPTAGHTSGIGENISDDGDSGAVSDLKTEEISETDRVADTVMRTGNSSLRICKTVGISQNADSLTAQDSHLEGVGGAQVEDKPKVILSSEQMGAVVSFLSEFAKDRNTENIDRSMPEKLSDDNDCGGTANDRKAACTSVETSAPAECKAIVLCPKVDSLAVANSHSDVVGDNKNEQKPPVVLSSELVKEMREDGTVSSGFSKGVAAQKIDVGINHVNQTDKKNKPVTAHLDSSIIKNEVEHVEASLKSSEVGKQCAATTFADGHETEECTSVAKAVASVSAFAGSELEAGVKFDLNEAFNGDDTRKENSSNFSGSLSLTSTPLQPSLLPASITVAAAAKGAFVPREDLLRNKATVGWRGSAATSAFRPAEPRKVQEVASCEASTTAGKQTKTFLDFDLNVPDERVLEDLPSQRFANPTNPSGGLDLDLNRLDDPADMNNHTISSGHRVNSTFQQANLSSGGSRDFDLNDGPAVDDVIVESSLGFSQNSRSAQPMISGIRPGFSSWFPAVNNYSAMSIPQVLPERGNGPQRMVGHTSEASSYTPDMYRGPVLLSSPAVSFPPTAFQYPGFPFGTTYPISSANFSGASTPYMDSSSSGRLCFPPVNSQILGPGVPIPSNYPRPYVVNLPNGNSNGGVSDSNNAKWFRSGLDLNSGPVGHETDEAAALVQRQLSSSSSLPLRDEARMYQMSGGTLKRKEPDGRCTKAVL